jgi:hypothetical protein
MLPKLRARLTAALATERHARWLEEYCKAEAEQQQLAQEFAETYPAAVATLVDLFRRMQQCDRKCGEIDAQASAMNNEHRRLAQTELHARSLRAFSRSAPEIAKLVVLPDFDDAQRLLWPLRSGNTLAVEVASSMALPHPGPRWSDPEVQAQRRAEVEKSQRELGAHYAQQTVEQERRQNLEETERFSRRAG